MLIGVDPHKTSHTATAVDPTSNTALASIRVDATLDGYRALLGWARQFEEHRWAIEGARGLGGHLAQWLIARGEYVVDVPSTATARVRELSRGGRRKNDVIDAAAAACVAAAQGDADPVIAEGANTVFALLEEHRANIAEQRVRAVNQLHAILRDLVPGGAKTALTANQAAGLLRRIRPASAPETTRKQIGWDLVRQVRQLDECLVTIETTMAEALAEHGSTLTDIDGVGSVLAARILGRTRNVERFPTADAFAAYAGVAPVEASSGDRVVHRLSRSGDRRLNSAIHLIAVTQVRMRVSCGRRYYDTKIAEGKTHNEAMRCLKRRLASHLWRRMCGVMWSVSSLRMPLLSPVGASRSLMRRGVR